MSRIKTVKKRNKESVDFEPKKIESALKKAFIAVAGACDDNKVTEIVTSVVHQMESVFGEKEPSVEDVQDMVERELMKEEFFAVAKAYILYRYEHAKHRQQQEEEKKKEVLEKIEEDALMIVKRNGEKEAFSAEKIKNSLTCMAKGFEGSVDVDAILEQCRTELYDGITAQEISKALVMTTRAMIEQDPAYSFLASRILLHSLYADSIGEEKRLDYDNLDQLYRRAFIRNIKEGVRIDKLDRRLLDFDLELLSQKLKPERDELLMYLGLETLNDRYFVRREDKRSLETPQIMWMRVAMGLAINEKHEDRNMYAEKFYEIYSTLRFVSSTPTLFHSGTPHPQLSSCYLNVVDDDLDHIFKVYGDNANLAKWAGGIGTAWTNIRATGARIKKAGIKSQGVIPFLKIADSSTVAINRSGRRRGAACVYLETWHADIEDFLDLRKNTGDERRRTHDMDTANWIPDLFMKRVQDDSEWSLFSPDEVKDLPDLFGKAFEERYKEYEQMGREGKLGTYRSIKAKDLWKKMIGMLFETGHPWMTFKDPSNVRSPQDHVGVVHSSNLCTEITLNTSREETAVCNLGSVNLSRHMKGGRLDEDLIKDTVTTGMRMLDNVIDINFYPTKEAKTSNLRHRPVGLGIMGFQDALYLQNIPFDSEQAVEFADYSMEVISYYAILGSSQLAKEKGAYETFEGSKWDRGIFPVDTLDLLEQERGMEIDVDRKGKLDWTPVREHVRQHGMRNSNTMAMAPTATISNIAGSVPTIEPIYKNIYVKSNISGDFTVVNQYLIEDLKRLNLWDYEMLGKIKYNDGSIQGITEIPQELKDKYKEVFEIDQKWLVKCAAHRGKWIDQSQSLNIYYGGSSGKEVNDIFFYVWQMGLKTTYYLRTLGASQVEKSTVGTEKYGDTHTRKSKSAQGQPAQGQVMENLVEQPMAQPVAQPQSVGAQVAPAETTSSSPSSTPKAFPVDKSVRPSVQIAGPVCEACE